MKREIFLFFDKNNKFTIGRYFRKKSHDSEGENYFDIEYLDHTGNYIKDFKNAFMKNTKLLGESLRDEYLADFESVHGYERLKVVIHPKAERIVEFFLKKEISKVHEENVTLKKEIEEYRNMNRSKEIEIERLKKSQAKQAADMNAMRPSQGRHPLGGVSPFGGYGRYSPDNMFEEDD